MLSFKTGPTGPFFYGRKGKLGKCIFSNPASCAIIHPEKEAVAGGMIFVEFVCYPKCSTCQKAKRFLDAHGVAYTLRDIQSNRPSEKELYAWWKASGLPLRKFFNTSGLAYRALSLKEKLPEMSEEQQLKLLAALDCFLNGRAGHQKLFNTFVGKEYTQCDTKYNYNHKNPLLLKLLSLILIL